MMTSYEEVAVSFASALIRGDFERARGMLAPGLASQLTVDSLRDEFFGMFRGYASGEPERIHFDDQFSMSEWPAKEPGDVGWVYVGIEGDDFVEAVAVVVCETDGILLIRNIEWGRP